MSVGGGVGAAAYEIIFGFNFFATGAVEWSAFHDHHVSGRGHGEVGLGGDDHAKGLQVGEGFEVRVAVLEGDFTEIYGTSLGGDGPEHVGQIFETEFGGVFEALELDFDLEVGLLAFDFRFARGTLQQVGALEIYFGGAALQSVVDGLGGACDGGAWRGLWGLGGRESGAEDDG